MQENFIFEWQLQSRIIVLTISQRTLRYILKMLIIILKYWNAVICSSRYNEVTRENYLIFVVLFKLWNISIGSSPFNYSLISPSIFYVEPQSMEGGRWRSWLKEEEPISKYPNANRVDSFLWIIYSFETTL
jgi:hypothetical protein